MARVPNAVEILRKITIGWDRVHECYRRQTDTQTDRQTDGRATAYSEREREFTFAMFYFRYRCQSDSASLLFDAVFKLLSFFSINDVNPCKNRGLWTLSFTLNVCVRVLSTHRRFGGNSLKTCWASGGLDTGVQDTRSWKLFAAQVANFWATVCKTIRPMLSNRCLSLSLLSICLSCLWRWCTVEKRLDGLRWNFTCRRNSALATMC